MKHRFWIFGGLLLLAAALCFTGYNLYDEKRAGDRVEELLLQYQEAQSASLGSSSFDSASLGSLSSDSAESERVSNNSEMPAVEIGSNLYIGVLEIPSLDLSLPIMKERSSAGLKMAPCRYKGSVSQNNLIIAGHNYRRHFGGLRDLEVDDEVVFTDAEGSRFEYRVAEVTRLDGRDVEEMSEGEWDLTLFTCTLDSQSRVTVRCTRVDGDT